MAQAQEDLPTLSQPVCTREAYRSPYWTINATAADNLVRRCLRSSLKNAAPEEAKTRRSFAFPTAPLQKPTPSRATPYTTLATYKQR
ncbi:hypothetical protein ACLB2K_023144 [Fragaria x ananassa]